MTVAEAMTNLVFAAISDIKVSLIFYCNNDNYDLRYEIERR